MPTSRRFSLVSCETRGEIRRTVSAMRVDDGDRAQEQADRFAGRPNNSTGVLFIYREQWFRPAERGEYVGLGEWRGGQQEQLLKESFGINDSRFEFATEEEAIAALNTVHA